MRDLASFPSPADGRGTDRPRPRRLRTLALALALGLAPVTVAGAAPSVAAECQTDWGTRVKGRPAHTGKQVVNLRAGQHRCFDRIVIDVNNDGKGRPGYNVRYVRRVTFDGSGDPVPLRGGARLRVIVRAPAFDDQGHATYQVCDPRELVDVSDFRTLEQVAWAGSFEGQTTFGVGVRKKLPFRVFRINDDDGGHRIVIDVAHRS